MTTLVALATKDALVMGCDSLGTSTKDFVDPFDLVPTYFDPDDNWKLKTDAQGNPVLKTFNDIMKKAQEIPYNQMTHVGKLFSFKPLPIGAMITGIASIGNRTIKSLINEFSWKLTVDYSMETVAKGLLEFINKFYISEFSAQKPYLELMVGGYDRGGVLPLIYRIIVHKNEIEPVFSSDNPFGIVFGGQMQEIQRIVFGTDSHNKLNLIIRLNSLYEKYRAFLQDYLKTKGIFEELPKHTAYEDDLFLFNDWDLDGFDADWGDFSEQNAIECVHFFVEIMINSQVFSSRLPTVGGEVHIGLITKGKGFRFISKEEYVHEGHVTPREG